LGLRLVLSFLLHFDRCKLMPRQHNRTFIFLLVAVALSLTSAHAEGTPPPPPIRFILLLVFVLIYWIIFPFFQSSME
jgi:hypothetical protein